MEYGIVLPSGLTKGNIEFYKKQGYLIAPDLLGPRDIQALKKEAVEIFKGNRGHVDGMTDVEGLPDDEVLKKYVAVHFPHKLSSVIQGYLSHPFVVDILSGIVGPNVKCMQSMLFVKGPGKAGQAWHQDEFYIPTRDRSLVGAWIAIDDATIGNGCLWIIPGSQKTGVLFRRVPSDSGEYADVDTVDVSTYPKEMHLPVEVKSGSVIFFNGYTLHSSLRNKTADCFRMALVNHYMSAESLLPWDQDGKLPPTEDLRDILMVAGTDPYSWKGITDLNKPYLRPEVLKIKTT
ncbi:phytanoyl-CoA dioxygenase family protein [Dinghuibacter silviterrae]|uniref:Phytanoyl-CoA dioxygenase PhyH n=1 Tax=Dinghuibacter silviterrae TaxID=1539049 RepID=A0A4R8DEG7_9BACT|nr:phytanoyl-CoA dioxygenase family protein [Dinghuibacter silviterrae]TDW95919.1 phytanoyl-CoA dioxygenase PhyH [Dinghuibacter silviterrae]